MDKGLKGTRASTHECMQTFLFVALYNLLSLNHYNFLNNWQISMQCFGLKAYYNISQSGEWYHNQVGLTLILGAIGELANGKAQPCL